MNSRVLAPLLIICGLIALLPCFADATVWYVSPSGSDTSAGTIDAPWKTIATAVTNASAGDTILLRGGTYVLTARISIAKSGTAGMRFTLAAYPGERALLDFSPMPVNSANRGVVLSGSYWTMQGLDIRRAGDNGMFVSGSHNVIEWCTFADNKDTGLQLGGGASDNRIINCDSFNNADTAQGNADGFSPKLDVGSDNVFIGCRAWQNSDDGWDGYLRGADDVNTTLIDCWCFMNGYLASGAPSAGNGNGFKMGGGDNHNAAVLKHNFTLLRCVAFDNRVKGFDQNNNRGSMVLRNCSGYRNQTNYAVPDSLAFSQGKTLTVVNSLSLGLYGSLHPLAVQHTNSWMGFVVTEGDFVSIDTTGVRGPRKPDGSLPDVSFLHLASGSPLIDAGTDIGQPYLGLAPDLGAFESTPASAVSHAPSGLPGAFSVLPNYPNPFNPSTEIQFDIPVRGFVRVEIFALDGRSVKTLIQEERSAGRHRAVWEGRNDRGNPVASGVYLARVVFQGAVRTIRMLLLR